MAVEEDGKLVAYTVWMNDGRNGLAASFDNSDSKAGDEEIELYYGSGRIGYAELVETVYLDELRPKAV